MSPENKMMEEFLKSNGINASSKEEKEEEKDLCLECGNIVKPALWGGKCHQKKVVHQQSCNTCGRFIGYMMDDDYCGLTIVICPDCMDKVRKIKNNKE